MSASNAIIFDELAAQSYALIADVNLIRTFG
jgi:hypothetical protein